MGHVFGIGSLWFDTNLNDSDFDGDLCDNSYLENSFAQQEWNALGCSGVLPVECRQGAEGTLGAHWDEGCLKGELMTGFDEDGPEPLSTITIGTLKDQGYEVDFSTADPFSIDDLGDCPGFCPELSTRRKRGLRPNEESRPGRSISQEAMEGLYVSGYKIVTGNRPLNKVISSMKKAGRMSQGVDIAYLDEYNPNGPKIVGKYVSLEAAVQFLQNKDDAWLTANGIIVSDESI
jgi:Leishmanolysin